VSEVSVSEVSVSEVSVSEVSVSEVVSSSSSSENEYENVHRPTCRVQHKQSPRKSHEQAASWTGIPVHHPGMTAAASQITQRVGYRTSPNRNGAGKVGGMSNFNEEPVTMSEPGGGYQSAEQDRFAAYINRFAEMDPRMDYRGRAGPPSPDYRGRAGSPSQASVSTGNTGNSTGNHPPPHTQRSERQVHQQSPRSERPVQQQRSSSEEEKNKSVYIPS
jgi:hypothetical protein